MSILIKGAKMPKSCGYCFFNDFNICQVEHFTVADAVYHEERHENCPLVEVPPHGGLIDENEILKYQSMVADCSAEMFVSVDDISDAPTVIESEEEK